MKYFQIAFIAICLSIFIAAGFDKEDAYFEDVSFDTFSGTISEAVILTALPTGYSYVTVEACPSGFSEVPPGADEAYVSLGGSVNLVASSRNLQVPGHYHTFDETNEDNDLETSTDEITASASALPSHRHDFTHRHAVAYLDFVTAAATNDVWSANNLTAAYGSTTPGAGTNTVLTMRYSGVYDGTYSGIVFTQDDYFMTSYPVSSTGNQVIYTNYTESSDLYAHTHPVSDFVGDFNSAASESGDAAFDVSGELNYVRVRLCKKD